MSRHSCARWLAILLMISLSSPATAAITNLSRDVGTAIDRGLVYLDAVGAYSNPSTAGDAAGLVALALLEKRQSLDQGAASAGYVNASPVDQARIDRVMAYILGTCDTWFYAYRDGGYMMAVSVYLRTGGPLQAEALTCLRQAFDRTRAAQGFHGYWCYTDGSCRDSSTTQFAMAGLAAARGVFTDPAYSDPVRLAQLDALTAATRASYALYGTSSGFPDEKGHGYNQGSTNTLQQTASGLWGQIIGGANINDADVQAYMRWLYNRYNYRTIAWANDGWSASYHYFHWSFAKSVTFLQDAGIPPLPGNLGVDAYGTLDPAAAPAFGGRLLHTDLATEPRVPSMGPGGPGYYLDPAEPARTYTDQAIQLMKEQDANGWFAPPPGDTYWNPYSSESYVLLVLERSVGGGCVDSDGDGVCDADDDCPAVVDPNQSDADGDGRGDACDDCPSDPAKVEPGLCGCGVPDVGPNGQSGCGDDCDENVPPVALCPPEKVEVPVDEACDWSLNPNNTGLAFQDEHAVTPTWIPASGHGLGVHGVEAWGTDTCDAESHHCLFTVFPRDRLPPRVTVHAPLVTHHLVNGWLYNWTDVLTACDLEIADNCTHDPNIMRGIIEITSSDPNEVIEGAPGYFVSSGILADWAGFLLNLDRSRAHPRTYRITYVVVDQQHNATRVSCDAEVLD